MPVVTLLILSKIMTAKKNPAKKNPAKKKSVKKKSAQEKAEEEKGKKHVMVPFEYAPGKWRVSLGVEIVGGKRIWKRKQFQTKSAAQDFCNERRNAILARGEKAAEVDSGLVLTWMAMETELQAIGAGSLLDAGKRVLRDTKSVQKKGTAKECFDACHADYSRPGQKRGSYRSDLRNRCGRFLRYFGNDRPVLEITPEVITAYMETLPNKGDFKTLSAWLGWAAKKRWLPSNPCIGLTPDAAPHGKVVTLQPHEAARMLRLAVETKDWEVLAHVAISLFSGLRPAEFRKVAKGDDPKFLLWDHFKGEHLALPPELCKNGRRTGQGRTIKIEPTLAAWIDFLREKKGGILTGKVLSDNWKKNWESWRKKNWLDADGKPIKWPKDCLRHSFGSYHLGRGRSLAATSFEMENSPKILKKHYWNWETLGSEAQAYWELFPNAVLKDPEKKSLQVVV